MRKVAMVYVVRTLALILLATPLLAGCSQSSGAPRTEGNPVQTGSQPKSGVTPEAFLQQYGLHVEGDPARFSVKVPASWNVPLGAYPTGLYWGLANVFSKDAGFDLAPLKGKTVDVLRYALAGGLPGEREQSKFQYPSDVILLIREQAVVGAWLAFNTNTLGPSVRERNLEQITGLKFNQWVAQEQFFADPGKNGDLAALGPAEVLNEFFEAINAGDKTRANACLTPHNMLESLTMNLGRGNRLYNPDFGRGNSYVENIVRGKLISYKLMDPDDLAAGELQAVGDRRRIELAATVELTWRERAFNFPGTTIRFTILEKYSHGWKLDGLGTGP